MRHILKLDTNIATMVVIATSLVVELLGGNGLVAGIVAMVAQMPFIQMKRNHRICNRGL
jgi:hypothetical protein